MSRSTLAIFLALLLAFSALATAQVRAKGSISPEAIETALLKGNAAQKEEISKSLDLRVPLLNGRESSSCTDFDSVKTDRVHLLSHGPRAAVMKATSSACQYTYLIVLTRNASGAWRYVRTVAIWAKYSTPNISFRSLIAPNEEEIIVTNYVTDYGSGISQVNFTIWKLFESGLQVVFDEPMRLVFAIPVHEHDRTVNSDQGENSEFTFVNNEASQRDYAGRKHILQKQVIRDHQIRITRWWQYFWVPELKRFRREATWQ